MKLFYFLFLSLILIFNFAFASSTSSSVVNPTYALHPKQQKWEFDGIFGKFDKASAQRGYQVYKEVCSACHGLKLLSYVLDGNGDVLEKYYSEFYVFFLKTL